jgi:hypothetical protein
MDSAGSVSCLVKGPCEHDNEPPESLDELSDHQLLKKDL